MNTPYRKQFNEDGTPVKFENVVNYFPNRKQRREVMQKNRAFNNSKNHQMHVGKTRRWNKRRQVIFLASGEIRKINHLDFVK